MTICISVRVSEGLVLAADSMATVEGEYSDGNNVQKGVLKTFPNARKLSQLKDYPIGILSWGSYTIGERTVESLIREFEYSLPSLIEERDKRRLRRLQGSEELVEFSYSVQDLSKRLNKHIKEYINRKDGEIRKTVFGLLVGGYSSKQFFPEQWVLTFPGGNIKPARENHSPCGANWFGVTDSIVRFHWGRDDRAGQMIADKFKVDKDEVMKTLNELQYPTLFDAMPLQEAIDYAYFLVNIAIGRARYVIGAPTVGGEIDIIAITPNEFKWVKRKEWSV